MNDSLLKLAQLSGIEIPENEMDEDAGSTNKTTAQMVHEIAEVANSNAEAASSSGTENDPLNIH